jgi:1-acyl-sn-glycerol-3-phosphate acyltransferase
LTAQLASQLQSGMNLPAQFRRAHRLPRLIVHIAWGVALVLTISNWRSAAQWDRTISRWSAKLLQILGVHLTVIPSPQKIDHAVLVANHISWLDIFVIHAARRVHFVSKSEVRRWPVAGWLAWKSGTLFIERERRADAFRINQEIRSVLKQGAWVAVFPEGTTSDGRQLRRFKPSLLQPAVDLGLPVIPAAVRYRHADDQPCDAVNYIDQISMGESLWRISGAPTIYCQLEFAPAISGEDRRDLARAAQTTVARMLGVPVMGMGPESGGDLQDAGP